MQKRITQIFICLQFLAFVLAASAQTPAADAFTAKDYAKYFTFVMQELPGTQFAPYQRVGIALAKTDGWDAESGKLAREKLKTSKDGLRQLEGAYLLARGELRGLKMLFLDGPAPGSPAEFTNVARLYREHGCEIAASACDVIYSTTASGNGMGLSSDPIKAEAGIRAWARIPADQLVPLTQVLEGRFANNPRRLRDMASNIEDMIKKTMTLSERTGLGRVRGELCLLQGKRCIDQAKDAMKRGDNANGDVALAQVTSAVQRDPSNSWMLIRAVDFMQKSAVKAAEFNKAKKRPDTDPLVKEFSDREIRSYTTGLSLCQDAVKNMPEPGKRDARILYLTYLRAITGKNIPGAIDPLTFQTNADTLTSADALLVDGKLPEAAAKYSAILNEAKQPLANRLDAWAGLLESDPATALPAGGAFVTEIGKLDAATRPLLLQWFAWHLWQIVGSEVALPKDEVKKPYVAPHCLSFPVQYPSAIISTVKDGYAQVATLIDQCLAIDSMALLKQDPSREWMDLRLGFSMLYLLLGQPEKGGKLALQRIEETLPAPPWGWRDPIWGDPLTNSDKPKLFSYPDDKETLALIPDLIIAVNGSHIDARQGCNFYGYLAPVRFERYKKAISVSDMGQNYFDPIASIVGGAITLLERDAPPTGTDTKDLDLLTKALKELMNDRFTQHMATDIAFVALLPAIRSAKTIAVRDLLFELIDESEQIYSKIAEKPLYVSNNANVMALQIEYQRDDLKPYAQRLREKYPKTPPPAPPVPPAK